jgi:hypothetical protein
MSFFGFLFQGTSVDKGSLYHLNYYKQELESMPKSFDRYNMASIWDEFSKKAALTSVGSLLGVVTGAIVIVNASFPPILIAGVVITVAALGLAIFLGFRAIQAHVEKGFWIDDALWQKKDELNRSLRENLQKMKASFVQ